MGSRLPLSADRYQLFLQGRQRVELVQMLQNEPYFEAKLREVVPRVIPKTVKTEQLMNKSLSLFEKLTEEAFAAGTTPRRVATVALTGFACFALLLAALAFVFVCIDDLIG